MQLMPSTAAALGVNAVDPNQAIDGAARLLSGYLRSYGGSVDLALAAYSAGGGAVARYGGVPPYAETQNAIRKVRAIYEGTPTS
jgi:soluble lytic murein transglycosylase-like protein